METKRHPTRSKSDPTLTKEHDDINATKMEFDVFASNYSGNLAKWVALTGESIEFYAHSRIKLVAKQLHKMGLTVHNILDFGCGVGTATPFFLELFGTDSYMIGVDVSLTSLDVAKSKYSGDNVSFFPIADFQPKSRNDLAYCNGVFHHIPLRERDAAIRYVFNSLRPGGIFAFWENNPWNPIVHYNMSHADIDRNAIPIDFINANKILASNGFKVIKTRFYFIFPSFLRILRPLESVFSIFPIGAQYVVFCQKM